MAGVKIGSGSCSDSRRPAGSSIPQTAPVRLVVLPARAGDVAAHDALHRHHLEPLDEHRAAAVLLGHVGVGDEVVRADVAGAVEPERGQAGEHLALVRDRRRVDHVVGGDAVGGDQQQAVVARGVDVADLPLGDERGGFAHAARLTSGEVDSMCAVRAPSRDPAICVRTRIDADWQRTGPGPFIHGRPEIQVPAGAPRAGPRRVFHDRCVRPSGAVGVLRRHDGRLDRAVRGRTGRLAHGSRSGQSRRRRPAPARHDSHRRGPLRDGRRLRAAVRCGRRRPAHGQGARAGRRQRRSSFDRRAPGGPQRLCHRSPLRQGPPVHDRPRTACSCPRILRRCSGCRRRAGWP